MPCIMHSPIMTSKQLGAAWRTSLLDDLSLCTAASLINVSNLLDNSSSWGIRVETAVLCVFEHTLIFYLVDRTCGILLYRVTLCDLATGFAKTVPMMLRHSLPQRLQMCVIFCYLHDFTNCSRFSPCAYFGKYSLPTSF
jgi:hypothetical protein